MRRRNRIVCSLFVAAILMASALPSTRVEAGARTLTIQSNTIGDSGTWNNLEGDVVDEGGKLVFPKNSTDRTAYISKAVIRGDKFFDELESMECTIKFNQLPAGQKFILAFGLGGIEAGPAERENIEVTFTNEGGLKVGVVAYEDDDAPTTICKAQSVGVAIGATFNVKATISTSQIITLYINNKQVASGKLPVTGEGRIGFLQTGNCGAEVTNLKLTYYQYDRPENTNIEEDFKEDGINIAVLAGKTLVGSKTMSLEEYNGNQVLMFKGVGQTYLGTKFSYSNFEMTFDVPYLVLKTTTNEDGEPIDGTGSFGISFGSGRVSQNKDGYSEALDAIVFRQGKVYSNKNQEKYTAENPYWQEGKAFSVKVALTDNIMTVGAKWVNEDKYVQLLNYDLGGGLSTGCIHLWIMDQGNMAIDNLVIKNTDDNPGTVERAFKNGKIEAPADAKYVPFKRVYAPGTTKPGTLESNGLSWYLLIPAVAVVGALAVGTTALIVKCKGKKKEEVASDEK